MSDEERPLLESRINHVEPTEYEHSFDPPSLSRLSVAWRLIRRLDDLCSNWLLYPLFWISLWIILKFESLQGVCYRSPCRLCRKKSGTVEELTAFSDAGCQYCGLFTEVLAVMAPQIQPELGLFTLKSEDWFSRFPLELKAWNVGGFETARFRFLAPKGMHLDFGAEKLRVGSARHGKGIDVSDNFLVCDERTSCYPGSFHVPEDSASDESVAFAFNSVKDCVNSHKLCRKSRKSPLPRRVIDVCNFDLTSEVKLYESRGERAKYIALSHTWGHKHTFMTTRANVADRKSGIALHVLPKTFQDVVFMARKFRIRFIWIDSLCIIQDDLADWSEESPKMGAIYGGAYLTIAAGSALSDESGFLGLRSDLMYRDFYLKRRIRQCVTISRVQDLTAPERRDPLSFRAWAFQERLLSRRTLYYHQQELVFECKRGLRCECMSCSRVLKKIRRAENTHWERLGINYVPKSFPRVEMPTSSNIDALQDFWHSFIVPEYSARSITRDSDRLPALSSVAAAVQGLSGDIYLAGMWRQSLPSDLAWNAVYNTRSQKGDRVFTTLPASTVAPSWCWASINGPVEYKDATKSARITYSVSVVHAECTILGTNPLGNVANGSLTLSGTIIYGACELQAEPHKLWPYSVKLFFTCPNQMTLGFEPDIPYLAECAIPATGNILYTLQPKQWLSIGRTLRRGRTTSEGEPASGGIYGTQHEGLAANLSFGRVICVLLYKILQLSRCEWVFLVLGHSSNFEAGYERLGMLTCWVNGWAEWEELDAVTPQLITIW